MQQVMTKKGLVEGTQKNGFSLFLGIPYAKPPIGNLRWRPPQEAEAWEGVYRAQTFPPRSMQVVGAPMGMYDKEFYDEPSYQTAPSEDSLYLNIWTPAESAGEGLPVAFWLHGGAFLGGFGHEKEFDGEAYCKHGVILVTVNYRLGPVGFLAHPWLSEESRLGGGPAVSGNYGILDQIAALKWVRENIVFFGGDPDNITVFGQSAGCMSVQTLVSSPLTRGMIAKAILQSGVGLSTRHSLETAERQGLEFAANAGVHSLEEMRALSFPQIMAAAGPLIGKGFATNEPPYTPVTDGILLTDDYDRIIEEGRTLDIPYLLGSTRDDIATNAAALAGGYRGPVFEGSRNWCMAQLKNGRDPAYLYYFTHALPGDDAGAFHSSELWYMFGTYGRCWRPMTEADAKLSLRMVAYWTRFMKTGDPNGKGLPRWSPYRCESDLRILDVED